MACAAVALFFEGFKDFLMLPPFIKIKNPQC
jgi:hypothetical protein